MPLTKLELRPGLCREGTDYSNSGGWFDGDKIRFRSGFPEKIGGWTRLSNNTFEGVARSLWNWIDLDGTNYVGVGTNLKYYVEKGGEYYDITPIRKTVNPMANNPFSTSYSTLSGNIDATQTTIALASTASFPNGPCVIQIGSEQIYVNGKSGSDLVYLIRGYNGTTAASHSSGAAVGCSTITVTDTANGSTQNDFVTFSGATAFGGFSTTNINAEQQITFILGSNNYTFNVDGVFSTSATSGGGAAVIAAYQILTGLDVYVIGTGWGAGPWGRGGWGSGYTSGIGEQLRLWTADNYGQDLVLAPRGGAIYYWQDSLGVGTRAKLLSELATTAGYSGQFVPTATNWVVSSDIQRFIVSFGANPYDAANPNTAFDPMLVRWSDQDNPYQWVPEVTNQSGEYRLNHGSYIVSAEFTRQETLIWTDSTLYSMQYLGAPYVWGFTTLMDNISIMGPNAAVTINNVTYWMGQDKFYMYSGRVETLPCALKQYIFEDLNSDQSYQVFAGGNEGYNEIWWFYCSGNSTVIDKYVIYNYLDRVWYYGTMSRTAWLDSGIRPYPMATNYDNRILYHESSVDDESGLTPEAIYSYVQSSDFDINDGHQFSFVWRMLPDVNFNGSTVNAPAVTMTVKPRQNSGAPYGSADAPTVTSSDNYVNQHVYTVQEFTGQVYTRLRGRQLSLRVESGGLGVAWQLGVVRIDTRADGRR